MGPHLDGPTPSYLQWRTWPDLAWVDLPPVDEPLRAVTHLGNGRNAYLTFNFVSGRHFELPVKDAHVETDGRVGVTVCGWGDGALRVDYTGTDLTLRRGRIAFNDDLDDPWTSLFQREARAWIDAKFKGELNYAVAAELRLSSSAPYAAV